MLRRGPDRKAAGGASPGESYRPVPIPPGVRVEGTELDGPVFADAKGKTLYQWPLQLLRNGPAGDPVGISTCTETRTELSAGLMSPYRHFSPMRTRVPLANGPPSNARTVRYSGRTAACPFIRPTLISLRAMSWAAGPTNATAIRPPCAYPSALLRMYLPASPLRR